MMIVPNIMCSIEQKGKGYKMKPRDYYEKRRESAHKEFTLAEKNAMINVEKLASVLDEINKEMANGKYEPSKYAEMIESCYDKEEK